LMSGPPCLERGQARKYYAPDRHRDGGIAGEAGFNPGQGNRASERRERQRAKRQRRKERQAGGGRRGAFLMHGLRREVCYNETPSRRNRCRKSMSQKHSCL
jgi:hypothetical protein